MFPKGYSREGLTLFLEPGVLLIVIAGPTSVSNYMYMGKLEYPCDTQNMSVQCLALRRVVNARQLTSLAAPPERTYGEKQTLRQDPLELPLPLSRA